MLYFLLSKILSFAINPLLWLLILILLSHFYPKHRKKLFTSLLFIILVLGNTIVTNEAVRLWEKDQYATRSVLQNYNSFIILGGFNDWNKMTQMQDCNAAGDRLFNILPYMQDSSKNVIISGGSARLYKVKYKEADICKIYLSNLHDINAKLYYEDKSRNTKENILYSKQIVDTNHLSDIAVISSATHIRRIKKILTKKDLKWDAYGVESAMNLNPSIYDYFIPQLKNLSTWNALMHEWIGYIFT